MGARMFNCATKLRVITFFMVWLLPPISVSHAWDPIRDLTGKTLKDHVERGAQDLRNAPKSWGRCVSDPVKCTEKELRRIPHRMLWPIIGRYKNYLNNQASGRWKSLPRDFIKIAKPYYPGIDLNRIRYATNINTKHGQALTWHYRIYFPGGVNLDKYSDVRLMLHEIEHTVQYEGRGGEKAFLSEYILKSVGKVIERQSFNVHDYIDIERAANRKADRHIQHVFHETRGRPLYLVNDCHEEIRLAFRYRNFSREWNSKGWYTIDGKEKTFLASNGRRIRFDNSVIYFFAEGTTSNKKWRGDHNRKLRGKTLRMKQHDLHRDKDDDWRLKLVCS